MTYFGIWHIFVHNLFFHTHNTISKIQQSNRHILNISRSNQKGGGEGRTTRTQKSLLYTITYVQQETLPSNGLDYCLLHSFKPANNILFYIELIPESSLRRHKLGLTDQSIHSNDGKTRFGHSIVQGMRILTKKMLVKIFIKNTHFQNNKFSCK